MFRIFSRKHIIIISVSLCILLLSGSLFNIAIPHISASGKVGVTVPVVMYHQVCSNPSVLGDYAITPEVLRNDFEYMKKHNIHPVSFSQLSKYVKFGEALPENPIVLTFDDGERSFLTKALPLLQEYNFPANINIVGALVELYTKNGETDDRYAYLNADDIKLLTNEPLVEIGYHSYNLHSLSNRRGMGRLYGETDKEYEDLIYTDIEQFNKLFLSLTGSQPVIAAYPFGIRNDKLQNLLQSNNFSVTLTCRESPNTLTVGDDLFELGRFNRPYRISTKTFFESIF